VKLRALLLLPLFLCGCQTYPYAEVGFGYKLESTSVVLIPGCDYVTLSPTHETREYQTASCGGQNPTGHLNIGLEFGYDDPSWWKPDRVALEHWSHPRDGKTGRRETHKDEAVLWWKVGGRPEI